ncbi:hypothetical protein [Methylobacterium phyllostachyos]|nr:hypothetical protein [Methylobacterium phyllostachyos]
MTAVISSEAGAGSARLAHRTAFGVLGGAVTLVVPLLLLAVPQSDTVVIVGAAGSDAGDLVRLVAEAGGSILNVDGVRDIAVARAEGGGFVGRLYATGARLVLDGRGSNGCAGVRRDAPASSRPEYNFESIAR